MSGQTKHPSRRRVMTLAVASVSAAALPSWTYATEAGGAVVSPAAVPIANASIALGLSPVFAEVAARLEGLKVRYLETLAPYMALDEEFRCLRFSHNEAERNLYCAHEDVRAYHVASRAFGALLWKGLNTHARTLADCAAQEQCEQMFAASENTEQVESWRRYMQPMMAQSREFVRGKGKRVQIPAGGGG